MTSSIHADCHSNRGRFYHTSSKAGGRLFVRGNLGYDTRQREIRFWGLIKRFGELANFKRGRCAIAAFRSETRATFTCAVSVVRVFETFSPSELHLLGALAHPLLPLWPARDGWLVSLPGPRPGVEQLGKTAVGGRQIRGWGESAAGAINCAGTQVLNTGLSLQHY